MIFPMMCKFKHSYMYECLNLHIKNLDLHIKNNIKKLQHNIYVCCSFFILFLSLFLLQLPMLQLPLLRLSLWQLFQRLKNRLSIAAKFIFSFLRLFPNVISTMHHPTPKLLSTPV